MLAGRRTLGASLGASVVETFGGDAVVDGAQPNGRRVLAELDRLREAEGLLHALHLTDDVLAHQRNDGASGPGPSGTAGAVQVVDGLRRWVVVDYDRQEFDVDTARGDVGRHEDADLAALDAAQRPVALSLGAVAVQGDGGDAALPELAGQTVSAVLGSGEHDGALVLLDDVSGDLGALVAWDAPEVVVDVARGLVTHDVVDRRVPGELAYQGLDVRAHGRREQHHVPAIRSGADDTAHARQEPHVGHAVGLVDDDGLHGGEVEGTLFEHVLETARAGHDDVDAEVECLARDVVRRATVDRDHAPSIVVGQLRDLLLDLRGEFARGHEDQRHGLAGAGLGKSGHERQAEGEGLARARRGLADDVATGEGVGEGGLLNREGFGDAALFQTLHQV